MRYRFWSILTGRAVTFYAPLIIASFISYKWPAKFLVTSGAFLLVAIVDWCGVYRPIKRIEEKQRKIMDIHVKPFFEGARLESIPEVIKPHLRMNVMLVHLTPLGRRFYQCYQYKMDGCPDAELSFSINAGFCGQVFRWQNQNAYFKDLRNLSGDELKGFRWTKKQLEKTAHVKAVVSTPIFRKIEKSGGRFKHDWFGVVNVDATDEAGVEYLGDNEVINKIRSLAEFAQVTYE